MSELCTFEFEDLVLDYFEHGDDHLVPSTDFDWPDDNHKKSQQKITGILSNTEDRPTMGYVDQPREERGLSAASDRRNSMLENGSWSHTPCGVLPSDSDSIKASSNVASENSTLPSHAIHNNNTEKSSSEFGVSDSLLGEKIAAVDKSSLSYPISDISCSRNNFNFSGSTEDKDASDFLYYDLPEIENFEDVDRMFRSCDSTFGLGTSKEDELGWLTSVNTEGSGDGLRSDFKIPSPETNVVEKVSASQDSLKNYSINDSAATTTHMSYKDNSWTSGKSDPFMSFANESVMADEPEGLILKEQINERKKQFKLQDQSLGKRKDPYFLNEGISYMNNQLKEVVQMESEGVPDQATLQRQCLSPNSSSYLQSPLSYTHSDNSHLSVLTSVYPTLSPVKPETNDVAFPSPRDTSRVPNQLQMMDSHDSQYKVTAVGSGKREKLLTRQGSRSSVSSNLKKQSATVQAATTNPGLLGKQVQSYGDKVEKHSDVEGVSLVIPGELESSTIQESSSISSGMGDISLEAASFHQLQLVMEQLDLRTKLCIRDSLYRLARSAEQRHNRANFHAGCGPEQDASGAFMPNGTNNFMDMETDTNPIDRSIAHLLFHRPSESSATPLGGTLPFRSPNAVRGSITSTPIMIENSSLCEETASDLEKVSNC